MKMDIRQRYLTYLVLAFVPQLHGCLYDHFHMEGKVDAARGEEVSSKESSEEESTQKEEKQ